VCRPSIGAQPDHVARQRACAVAVVVVIIVVVDVVAVARKLARRPAGRLVQEPAARRGTVASE
jgi:hypothetical protein